MISGAAAEAAAGAARRLPLSPAAAAPAAVAPTAWAPATSAAAPGARLPDGQTGSADALRR
eukprot:9230772-Lingulodinium_polyedra.AAC.1